MAPASRILIVTNGPLCRNPRPLKNALALGRHGFAVTVLTVAHTARHEAIDEALIRGAPFRKISVDRVPRGSFGRLRALRHRIAGRISRQAAAWGAGSASSLGPARALARRASTIPADLAIVHTELGFYVGSRLLARGRRIFADFEDWHSRDLLPEARRFRPLARIEQWERTMLREASEVTAPSEAMAEALQRAYGGRRPMALRNAFPLQPEPPPAPRNVPPSILWFSQTIGPGRMLEPFIAAWRQTRTASRLCLLGEVSPEYRRKLIGRVPPERQGWIAFLPPVSPAELPGAIARHDLGLALEAGTPPSRNLTITNKILQYLNAGLAIFASDTLGQAEVFAAAPAIGTLARLFETGAVARDLDAVLGDPARLAEQGRAARRAAESQFCWEREEPRLLAAVEQCLAAR